MTSATRVVPWRRPWIFAAVGPVATVVTGALVVYRGVPAGPFPGRDVLVVGSLSAMNAALLWWLGPAPADALPGATPVPGGVSGRRLPRGGSPRSAPRGRTRW
ncbi:hypothetical protein BJF90_35265 [Pseudonocardia sp. CNS-004]|nr:hypothetical protein BJF90_35265 [Pseudonocardia sp. CNS-004]